MTYGQSEKKHEVIVIKSLIVLLCVNMLTVHTSTHVAAR